MKRLVLAALAALTVAADVPADSAVFTVDAITARVSAQVNGSALILPDDLRIVISTPPRSDGLFAYSVYASTTAQPNGFHWIAGAVEPASFCWCDAGPFDYKRYPSDLPKPMETAGPIAGYDTAQLAGEPVVITFSPTVIRIGTPSLWVFLGGWFGGDPLADVNGSNAVDVADIFDFFAAYFRG
jgi:hypothetical protein